MTQKIVRGLVTVWVALVAITMSPSVDAHEYKMTTLDATLLESDLVIVGDVESIEAVADNQLQVVLSNLSVVVTRWSVEERLVFNVRGYFTGEGGARPVPHQPTLRVGGRYLILLKGGAWFDAPIVRSMDGIYEVDKYSRVLCPGGNVAGLSSIGFVCAQLDDAAEAPVLEFELVSQLTAWARDARRRRPELASTNDGQHRLLVLTPEAEEISE
jgi:hypothetical protein